MKAFVAVAIVTTVLGASAPPQPVTGQQDPETLRAALTRTGFPIPVDLAAPELDRAPGSYSWDHDHEYFVAVGWAPNERALDLLRISKSGRVNRFRWLDGEGVARGGLQAIEIAPPYTLVHAHVSPSAGFTHVLDANLTLLASLFSLSSDVLADGTILFEGGLVHFADEHHQTFGAFNPVTKQVIEVFPGTFKSPYGVLVEQRIMDTLARIERERGGELAKGERIPGFDRYIETKKIAPNGSVVAFTVWYGNPKVFLYPSLKRVAGLPFEKAPVSSQYQFSTIVRCARDASNAWTCQERPLEDAAKSYGITLPFDPPARRDAIIDRILEREIAGR